MAQAVVRAQAGQDLLVQVGRGHAGARRGGARGGGRPPRRGLRRAQRAPGRSCAATAGVSALTWSRPDAVAARPPAAPATGRQPAGQQRADRPQPHPELVPLSAAAAAPRTRCRAASSRCGPFWLRRAAALAACRSAAGFAARCQPCACPPGPLLTAPRPARAARAPQVKKCLSIKGAEDTINKPHAFEISTTDDNMFFIADSDKARERRAPGAGEGGRAGSGGRRRCGRLSLQRWRWGAAAGAARRAARQRHAEVCGRAASRPHAAGSARCRPRPLYPQEKEDWINAVGRAIVKHSRRCLRGWAPPPLPPQPAGAGRARTRPPLSPPPHTHTRP
jgi:hypothetical protein